MTKEEFIKFVESWDWTFAKTYAKKSPHEYIVCKANHPRRAEFERASFWIKISTNVWRLQFDTTEREASTQWQV